MARKKKDFWDGVDDARVVVENTSDSRAQAAEEEWSAVKSTPIKVIMRLLLMISCLAALVSGYIAYHYIQDRYAGGSYSTDYFNSGSFAKEYNNSIDKLLELVQGIEADPSVLREGNEQLLSTLTENYMGKDTNFSFLIQDEDHYQIVSSGDDAKDRIEASNHYALISNAEGETTVKSSIPGNLLDKDKWSEVLSQTASKYIIYTTVDNELTRQDSFYTSSQQFDRMQEYFRYARIIGIVAAVLFVLSLIFCIMSTGMKRGVDGVCLSWFDRVFTEIAVIIMAVIGAAIVYGIYKLLHMDGSSLGGRFSADIYRYAAAGLCVIAYIWFIRCYFSIVRRIKAGQLLRHSIIGTIIGFFARLVGKLPKPLNYIVGALILIAINGGLVYCLVTQRQYTYKGIPIVFIAAPVILIIELLALLVHNSGSPEEEDEALLRGESGIEEIVNTIREEEKAAEEKPVNIVSGDTMQEDVREYKIGEHSSELSAAELVEDVTDTPEWENMDLSKEIEEAKNFSGETAENTQEADAANPHTLVLSDNEIEKALREAGFGSGEEEAASEVPAETAETSAEKQPEEVQEPAETPVSEAESAPAEEEAAPAEEEAPAPKINFVDLNKEVRKTFRPRLKERGIVVAMRAPEKPIYIDMDRESMTALAGNVFEQIERLSADQVKNYIETYVQGGRVVYIARVQVAADQLEAAAAAVGDDSFAKARQIAEANGGRFVVSVDGDALRAGMLIDEFK